MMNKILYKMLTLCLIACATLYPINDANAIISADTYNERHVQDQLNTVLLTPPDAAAAIASINMLPFDAQRDALNELSGE